MRSFLRGATASVCLRSCPACLPLMAGEFLTNYSASERESFYFKTDFHWNPRGVS